MAGLFGALFGAVGDIVGGEATKKADDLEAGGYDKEATADRQAAGFYKQASDLALQNVSLSKESTTLQQFQASREIYMTESGQRSDVAAAGFANSGSALDIARDTAAQGALTHAVIGVQSQIEQQGYKIQSTGLLAEQSSALGAADQADAAAAAARAAGKAAETNGFLGAIGGILGAFL